VNGYDDESRARLVPEPPKQSPGSRDDFVRDRARVLHSAALRRLAGRTQVVVVGESDFPRTRLTHSLECAQIGRELAGALGADPDLVDAACLAHDLGHPPFGHNGEAALDEFAAGIGGFEGNAQSFRVLTRLEAKVVDRAGAGAGLNLTRATLDAASKYPWTRQPGSRKFGVYADDLPVFTWMRSGRAGPARCVEAQIMDWADDVAYSVHDLEDGVQAGHVPLRVLDEREHAAQIVAVARTSYLEVDVAALTAAFERLRAQDYWLADFDGSMRAMVALKRMTSELIARLCSAATVATLDRAEGRPVQRYDGQLVVPDATRAECAVLKAIADRYVMQRDAAIRTQQRQREQLAELLGALCASAPDSLEPWLHDAYRAAPDDAARLRVVVDQVASLTDRTAVLWHERQLGARVPSG